MKQPAADHPTCAPMFAPHGRPIMQRNNNATRSKTPAPPADTLTACVEAREFAERIGEQDMAERTRI
ncbi:MAG: hypothetical protein ABI901_18055, partial [Roseiflexaceae bacterium]